MKRIGVLIVDDSSRMRKVIKRNISTVEGIMISGAANTAAGVQRFKAAPKIRLVVSDFQMPGPNGVQFYHEIKEELDKRGATFVILTGAPDKARSLLEDEDVEVLDKNEMIAAINRIKKLIAQQRDR